MRSVAALGAGLAWLGRQGTRAVALSLLLGLAVPQLAALLKPIVPEAIFVMLTLSFLRVDPRHLRDYLMRPGLVLAAAVWHAVVIPLTLGAALVAFGLPAASPALFLVLILQAASPPIMSAPAFAALMGLDAAVSLAVMIVCMMVTPFTAAFYLHLFVGPDLTIPSLTLGGRLLLIVAGSAIVATLIHRFAPRGWVAAQTQRIDGLNVIVLFIFAIAVMEGVAAHFIADPLLVLWVLAITFAVALGLTALTTLVFAWCGIGRAFSIGLAVGHRNLGLMMAATGVAVPDLTWLYFGLSQFPIYLTPQLLKPLARRFTAKKPGRVAPPVGP
ncbi:MAG: Na+-dependent transporter [Variibacter sp.]